MTSKPTGLRGLFASRVPILPPFIAELDIRSMVRELDASGKLAELELPLLAAPDLESDDLAFLPNPISTSASFSPLVELALISEDLGLQPPKLKRAMFSHLVINGAASAEGEPGYPVTRITEDLVRPLSDIPSSIDLLLRLGIPGSGGKLYLQPATQAALSYRSQRATIPSFRTADGIERNPRPSRPVVIDVFILLLPYLQPPLSNLFANPLLFPPDRRPRDYQIQGVKFLAEHNHALLGDEMGLGKTIQVIVALQVLFRQGRIRRVLVICPRSLLGNWEREIAKWAPEFSVIRVRGNRPDRIVQWQIFTTVSITTYETLRSDVEDLPSIRGAFDVVVADEAQKIKNATSGISRAVCSLRPKMRWALTGTPLENKVDDVISIFRFVKPGLFKIDTEGRYWDMDKIEPYFLRRRAKDVLKDLPEKEIEEVWLELTDTQRATYETEEQAARAQLSGPNEVPRTHIFALIAKLKQICNRDPKTGESCKMDFLIDKLDEIVENRNKALVFSHLPGATLRHVKPELAYLGTEIFDGSLSDQHRERMVQKFQEPSSGLNVLLMSVQAGGVGLTLTEASYVVHFDHWWNPAVARQAEGRAHRIGQKRRVLVHDLYVSNTIEQRIYDLLQRKQMLFDRVIDGLSNEYVENRFTMEDLYGLFDLKPPANRTMSLPPATMKPPTLPGQMHFESGVGKPTNRNIDRPILGSELTVMDPFQFEEYIAVLYTRMGFVAKPTKQSNDGGVDVIAQRHSGTGVERVLIQCKQMPGKSVGSPIVRDIIGVLAQNPDANRGIIVTTGYFSPQAMTTARPHRIELIDRPMLERLISSLFQAS